MDKDILLVLIGGLIGFFSSFGIIIVERILNRKGKVKIYYKFVSHRSTERSWGVYDTYRGKLLDVPTYFEIQNTSNSTKVLRDINIELFYKNKFVDKLAQISDTEKRNNKQNTEPIQYGAENNSYSFCIEPRSIHKFRCCFMFKIVDSEKETKRFDSLRISYYNERDKKKTFIAKSNLKGWDTTGTKPDIDWILLK